MEQCWSDLSCTTLVTVRDNDIMSMVMSHHGVCEAGLLVYLELSLFFLFFSSEVHLDRLRCGVLIILQIMLSYMFLQKGLQHL